MRGQHSGFYSLSMTLQSSAEGVMRVQGVKLKIPPLIEKYCWWKLYRNKNNYWTDRQRKEQTLYWRLHFSAVKNVTATSEYPIVSPVIQIFPITDISMTDLILTSTTSALAPKRGFLGVLGGVLGGFRAKWHWQINRQSNIFGSERSLWSANVVSVWVGLSVCLHYALKLF